MKISISTIGSVTVLQLDGQLDSLNVVTLDDVLRKLESGKAKAIVTEASRLAYVDASSLEVLTGFIERSQGKKSRVRGAIANPQGHVKSMIMLTGSALTKATFSSLDQALNSLRA